MNRWFYFSCEFETLVLNKGTTATILGIDNFLYCQMYKNSFSTFVSTDQPADSVHICFDLSAELTRVTASEPQHGGWRKEVETFSESRLKQGRTAAECVAAAPDKRAEPLLHTPALEEWEALLPVRGCCTEASSSVPA